MARDYKNHRRQQKKRRSGFSSVAWWKWALVVALIALFVVFLMFLRDLVPEPAQNSTKKAISIAKAPTKKPAPPKHQNKKPTAPEFSFYTILSEKEVNVPDYDIHVRVREENIGKGEKSTYRIQVGSFQQYAEADKLKARLAFFGVESRIEKATIGDTVWNRVRLGPYNSPSDVSKIKQFLKKNGIDSKVTEIKG